MAFSAASAVWILFFIVAVPTVTGILFAMPQYRRLLIGLMAFSTCHIKKPFYMEVFFEEYRGVDRGFGVTMPDVLFFGIALWLAAGGDGRKRIWWPHNTGPFVLLIFVSILSLTQSEVAYYGLFTVHKFIRGLVLYWVVVNLIQKREDLEPILQGLIAAVVFQGVNVLFAKYVTKSVVNRSIGSFPHPNTLAMYIDLIIPIALGLYLLGSGSKRKDNLAVAAVLLGMISVIFTKSRASLVLMMSAIMMVPPITFLYRPTARLIGVCCAGFLVVLAIGGAAAPKMIARFENAPKESAETREYFNEAAHAMASDYLFGTGLNSYSWVLGNTEYYWYVYPDKIGVENPTAFRNSIRGQSRLGTCHHIYYLFAAETGWIGMWIFILFLGRFYLKSVIESIRNKDPYFKAIVIGATIGFTTLHFQGLLEWIFRQTQVFYLFLILNGVVVAISRMHKQPSEVTERIPSIV